MSTKKYAIRCSTENAYVYTWATSEPSTCPNNAGHSVVSGSVFVVAEDVPGTKYIIAGASISAGAPVSIASDGYAYPGFGLSSKQTAASSVDLICVIPMTALSFVIAYTLPQSSTQNALYVMGATLPDGAVGSFATFGTPVVAATSEYATMSISGASLTSGTFFLAWKVGDSGDIDVTRSAFGTLSSTTVTMGVTTQILITVGRHISSMSFVALSATALCAAYGDPFDNAYAIAGTVSGTGVSSSATFGSAALVSASAKIASGCIGTCKIDSGRFLVAVKDAANDGLSMYVAIKTLNVVSFGARFTITTSTDVAGLSVRFISSSRALLCYLKNTIEAGTGALKACVLAIDEVTPNTITSGSAISVSNAIDTYSFDASTFATYSLIGYNSDGKFYASVLSRSDKTLTAVSTDVLVSTALGETGKLAMVPLSTSSAFIVGKDIFHSNIMSVFSCLYDGTGPSFRYIPTVVGERPVGVAKYSVSTGSGVDIVSAGVVSGYSDLVPGKLCYAHGNGSVSSSNVPLGTYYLPLPIGVATQSSSMHITGIGL